MYISKKELLQLTNISYGQLYRWKREGLIPESWFIKKSSYTGQETFFPKDKIIERVHAIQELKDKYSLEELAKILSPDVNGEVYISESELDKVDGINQEVLHYYKEMMQLKELSYFDFIIVLLFYELQKKCHISNETLHHLMDRNAKKFKEVGCINFILIACEIENNNLYLMFFKESIYMEMKKEQAQIDIYFDSRMKIKCEISLSELNDNFRKNNKSLFL